MLSLRNIVNISDNSLIIKAADHTINFLADNYPNEWEAGELTIKDLYDSLTFHIIPNSSCNWYEVQIPDGSIYPTFFLVQASDASSALDSIVDYCEDKENLKIYYDYNELKKIGLTDEEIENNYIVAGNYCRYLLNTYPIQIFEIKQN